MIELRSIKSFADFITVVLQFVLKENIKRSALLPTLIGMSLSIARFTKHDKSKKTVVTLGILQQITKCSISEAFVLERLFHINCILCSNKSYFATQQHEHIQNLCANCHRVKPLKENETWRNFKQGYVIREGLNEKSSSQVLSRYLLKI